MTEQRHPARLLRVFDRLMDPRHLRRPGALEAKRDRDGAPPGGSAGRCATRGSPPPPPP